MSRPFWKWKREELPIEDGKRFITVEAFNSRLRLERESMLLRLRPIEKDHATLMSHVYDIKENIATLKESQEKRNIAALQALSKKSTMRRASKPKK